MVRSSQGIKHTHIKIGLLIVDSPKALSSHIKASTTFSICRTMKEMFISNWLKSWFCGIYIWTYFRHQLGSNIPDLIMVKSRVLPCVTWDTVASPLMLDNYTWLCSPYNSLVMNILLLQYSS